MNRFARVATPLLVVVAGAMIAWAASRYFLVGSFNDDASYLNQARLLVRTGDVLTAAESPSGGLAARLPGFPLLLAPFVAILGDHVRLLQAVLAIGAALGCLLFAALARPSLGFPAAAMVGAAFLLNPLGIAYASTFMSDAWFAVVTAAGLAAAETVSRDEEGRPLRALGLGLLLGAGVLIRVPGVVTVVAALVLLFLRRRWRHALLVAVASAAPIAGYLAIRFVHSASALYYLPQLGQYYGTHTVSWGRLLWLWTVAALSAIGHDYLGAGEAIAPWAALPIVVLALAGWVRGWRKSGPTAIALFLPLYLLSLVVWPYFVARYLLPIWPLLLVFAASVLPVRARVVALALVVLVGLPSIGSEIALSQRAPTDRYASFEWLRVHAPKDDVVMAAFDATAFLLSGHRAVSIPSAGLPSELIEAMARDHVRWLVLEPPSVTTSDLGGEGNFSQPMAIGEWLDHSTLVQKVYQTPFDQVYRLAVDPARYQAAFTHYVRGAALADSHPREGERELEESLRLVPDFPEVEERLAVLRMSEGRDAVPMLQSVVGRYPTALSAAINLALALRAKGDEKQARATLEQARATAVRIGPSAASYLPIIARLL